MRVWARGYAARMAKRAGGAAKKGKEQPSLGEASGPGPRIVLLQGPDEFLRGEWTRDLIESLRKEAGEVEVVKYSGEQAALADVLDECRSYDLLMRHKVVVVDEAEKLVAGDMRPVMERYAEAPAGNATLVLRSGRWHKGKLDKLIEGVGEVRRCEPPKPDVAAAWAVARMKKRHDATLARAAADALVARVGPDLGRIDAELGKLAAAGEEGEPVTVEVVAAMVGRSGEGEPWAVQGPLFSGDAGAAIGAVREAIGLWRQNPVGVIWAEVDGIRKAAAIARLMEQGENGFAAAKRVRVWGDVGSVVEAGRRGGAERLGALLDEALDLDARSKSGRAEGERVAEVIAARFASLGG